MKIGGINMLLKNRRKYAIEKEKNDKLLQVLNVVQADIDKVLRDSQDILNQEIERLEKIKNG